MPKIDALLGLMAEAGCSDLHLTSSMPPMVRLHGDIKPIMDGHAPLKSEDIKSLLYEVMTDRDRNSFEERWDHDFAHEVKGVGRFRVNIFMDRLGMGSVMRLIPSKILTMQDLGLPPACTDFCNLSKGLVVVTGPTGSGKSTTLAAMVDFINRARSGHIITLEDPIEFVHNCQRCLINQREIGVHTKSFKASLRAALREDPNIVLVGEMRDLETVALAMETAETGHLVFATLHTNTAASTVDRIIDQFPAEQQAQIRTMLAGSLRGVVAQTLLKKSDGKGRAAAFEVLVVTTGVASNIRDGKTHAIPSAIQTGRKYGMVSMNDSILEKVILGLVSPIEGYLKAVDKQGLVSSYLANSIPFDPMQLASTGEAPAEAPAPGAAPPPTPAPTAAPPVASRTSQYAGAVPAAAAPAPAPAPREAARPAAAAPRQSMGFEEFEQMRKARRV